MNSSSQSLLRRAAILLALVSPLLAAGCALPDRSSTSDHEDVDGDDLDEGNVDEEDPCQDTPLVFSFDDAPVEYLPVLDSAYFDIGQHDSSVTTYWPTAHTPWLARDVNGNGTIDSGAELFGSETLLAGGQKAPDGFVALAPLDQNADSRVDADELAQGNLVLWRDHNGDRKSVDEELTSMTTEKILWIQLPGPTAEVIEPDEPRCDANGNCEIAWSGFAYLDVNGEERRGRVIDITLKYFARPGAADPVGDDPDDGPWAECF